MIINMGGGGGKQPQLHAPSFVRSGLTLTVTNPATNGDFVTGYAFVIDNVVVDTFTGTTYTITDFPSGEHTIAVRAQGENFKDSENSNTEVFAIYPVTLNLTHLTAAGAPTSVIKGGTLSLTLAPDTDWYLPLEISATVGGQSVSPTYNTSTGALSLTNVQGDVVITASAVDEPPIPAFANASWEQIRTVFRSGRASEFWSVGDTKQVTLTNGAAYTVRIADMQVGRYALADNTGSSNGVFEFVELAKVGSESKFIMYGSSTNAGGWTISNLHLTGGAHKFEELLPNDVLAAISEVSVRSGKGSGTTSGTNSSNNKLFIPAEMEIFSSKAYSIGDEECPLGQFDYYKTHGTDADRIKYVVGTTTKQAYWLRSTVSSSTTDYCLVKTTGAAGTSDAHSTNSFAPIFAI